MPALYLRGQEIDVELWDAAVGRDPTCLPYGLSWWMDAVTDSNWDGLILDNYRVVLPLPRGRSFGRFTQVQRAPFTQQGGPFGELRPGDVEELLSALPFSVLQFKLPLREQLTVDPASIRQPLRSRPNFVLNLDQDMPAIRAGFNRSLRRQLKKDASGQLSLISMPETISLYRDSVGEKSGLKPFHYRRIQRLAEAALSRGHARCYRFDDHENGLLAAGFFPVYRGRIINLFAASSAAGYHNSGMARLMVALMEKHGPDHHLFDFEGSEVPGITEFFKSFGPEPRPYLSTE